MRFVVSIAFSSSGLINVSNRRTTQSSPTAEKLTNERETPRQNTTANGGSVQRLVRCQRFNLTKNPLGALARQIFLELSPPLGQPSASQVRHQLPPLLEQAAHSPSAVS